MQSFHERIQISETNTSRKNAIDMAYKGIAIWTTHDATIACCIKRIATEKKETSLAK